MFQTVAWQENGVFVEVPKQRTKANTNKPGVKKFVDPEAKGVEYLCNRYGIHRSTLYNWRSTIGHDTFRGTSPRFKKREILELDCFYVATQFYGMSHSQYIREVLDVGRKIQNSLYFTKFLEIEENKTFEEYIEYIEEKLCLRVFNN